MFPLRGRLPRSLAQGQPRDKRQKKIPHRDYMSSGLKCKQTALEADHSCPSHTAPQTGITSSAKLGSSFGYKAIFMSQIPVCILSCIYTTCMCEQQVG